MHLGDADGAAIDIERSLALDATNEYAYENRAQLRLLLGDRTGAVADLERALAVDPTSERVEVIRATLERVRSDE